MAQANEIKGLLQSFVTNTLDIRGAILTNSKGLSLVSAFSYDVDENKETAITANFLSLIEQFEKDLTVGAVEKIIIEGQEGYCVLVGCENDLILLVLASKDIVKGWLFLEIKRLVQRLAKTCNI